MRELSLNIFDNNVCEQHGNRGMLPCAWPDCENGIADNQFQERHLPEISGPIIYTCREWHSPLGGRYYSWDSSALPNWFSAQQIFWNEARRHQLVPGSFPEVVYHYTSLEGFFGIVEKRSIYLSDFSYLNDRRELTYGADMAKESIRRMIEQESDTAILELLSSWEKDLHMLQNRVCIASFSGEDDSLSQWRAYGPVAIGFATRPLALHVSQSRLQPVEYRPEFQNKLLDIYIHHLRSAYYADISSGRLERIPDVYHRVQQLLELIAFFKDPAFKSENEYRLVYVDYPDVLERVRLKRPPKSFRISNGRIVPYVPSTDILPSNYRKFELEIAEIILGPECDELLERGVREFLDEKGLANVKSRHSLVPLRS